MISNIIDIFVYIYRILLFRITAPFCLKQGQCFVHYTQMETFLYKITEVSRFGKVKYSILYASPLRPLAFYSIDITRRNIPMSFKYLPEIQQSEFEEIENLFINAMDLYYAYVAEAKNGGSIATEFAPGMTLLDEDWFIRVISKYESDAPNDYVCNRLTFGYGWIEYETVRFDLDVDYEYLTVDDKHYEMAVV